ncbi:MAG: TolC family protein [Saprospiraceae bacterium]|nr:TolC family protein [Saprospiraceae bacterium]
MYRQLCFILLILGLSPALVFGQTSSKWSLEQCINYAQKNSLTIRQAQNTVRNSELTLKQNQYNRLPSLSGSVSAGNQYGRTIDPVTNDFNNQSIGFNSYGLNVGVTVFSGNRINNSIRQSKIDLEAAKLDADFQSDNLALQIANAYLSILLGEDQLELAQQRLNLSEQQLRQTDQLIQAGSLPENDRYDFISQIALDKQSIVEAENQVAIAYLNLKQLMELDPSEPLEIERPVIEMPDDINTDAFRFNEIYVSALGTQRNVVAADKRIESAKISIDLARAGYMPTLTIFGGLSTNFSTRAQRFIFEPGTESQTILINGQEVTLEFPTQVPISQNYPYFDQLSDNFGQNIGASLSIPIYSNHRNKINLERARLNTINQELQSLQIRQNLKTDVQRAIADARASQRSYEAAEAAVEASEIAYDNAQKRFDLGAINSLEFATARNNLDQARIQLVRARYSYIFNVKRVDFYMGKPIQLNR